MPVSMFKSWLLSLIVLSGLAVSASAATVEPIKLKSDDVEKAFSPRRLALLVGVQTYQDPKFHALRYPTKDVSDVTSFLRVNNHSDKDETISLTNEAATVQGLIHALDELEAKNTSSDDIVIVYLSMHGTLAYENAAELKRFAVLNDTRFDDVGRTGLSLDFIQNRLSRLKSQRKALVLAMCHSGSGKSQLPPDIERLAQQTKADFFAQPLHEVSSAMMVLSASAFGQAAREDDVLKNDIYTSFLLEGLAKNDANGDGAVSLFEAHEYARTRTYDFTRGQQTPAAVLNMTGTDPIILSGHVKRKSKPMVFADAEQFRNVQLYVNGEAKGTLWNPQSIESGRVRLALVDPRSPNTPLIDHNVFLQNDKAYAASNLIARQPTLGAEAALYALPLPASLDNLKAKDVWAPGVAVRNTEILGSRFVGTVAYFNRQLKGSQELDYEQSEVSLAASVWRGTLGVGFYPSPSFNLTASGGIESLSLNRIVNNPTVEEPQQSATLTYPVLGAGARWLDLFGNLYAGTDLLVFPARRIGLKIDDETLPLRPVSVETFLGVTL